MAFRELTGTIRAAAALPAAGVYDYGAAIPCNQYKSIDFLVTYTTGAGSAGGGVTYTVQWSNDNNIWYQIAELQAPVMAAGADLVIGTQRSEVLYTNTAIGTERFMTPNFDIGALFVRINVKETVDVGHPGTVKIDFYMNGESE